jgi:hypothetical protein
MDVEVKNDKEGAVAMSDVDDSIEDNNFELGSYHASLNLSPYLLSIINHMISLKLFRNVLSIYYHPRFNSTLDPYRVFFA